MAAGHPFPPARFGFRRDPWPTTDQTTSRRLTRRRTRIDLVLQKPCAPDVLLMEARRLQDDGRALGSVEPRIETVLQRVEGSDRRLPNHLRPVDPASGA